MSDHIIDHLPDSTKFLDERTTTRVVFFRKLYALLAVQYLVAFITLRLLTFENVVGAATVAATAVTGTANAEETATQIAYKWIKAEKWVGIACGILLLLLTVIVYFKRNWFRRSYVNVFTYIVFTLLLAYTLTFLSDSKRIVALFVASVLFLIISLLFYALTTRLDLTFLGGTIYIFGSALFSYLAFLIATDVTFLTLILLTLGIVILGFYLIFDTKYLTVGQSLSSQNEDPFVGAIVIYLDVVFIGFRLIESLGKVFKKNRF